MSQCNRGKPSDLDLRSVFGLPGVVGPEAAITSPAKTSGLGPPFLEGLARIVSGDGLSFRLSGT